MKDRKNFHRPLMVIIALICFVLLIGCGGGGEKPKPPYDPTKDQMEALQQFHMAADAYKKALLEEDAKKDRAHQDRLMNVLLMYMTADNGKSANKPGAMEYLVWYIQNYMMKEVAAFSGKSLPEQQEILKRLNLAYSYMNQQGIDPRLAAAANPLVTSALGRSQTASLSGLPTTGSTGPYTPNQSFSFNELAGQGGLPAPFKPQVVDLNPAPFSVK